MVKKYRYGDDVIEADESVSIEDVRQAWMNTYPAIENARVRTASDGTTEFVVSGGSKGL